MWVARKAFSDKYSIRELTLDTNVEFKIERL